MRGRLDEAEKTAQAALGAARTNYLARWVLGQVYRDRGKMDKADEQFDLVRPPCRNKRDVTDPDEMRIFGLAGLERARYLHLNR